MFPFAHRKRIHPGLPGTILSAIALWALAAPLAAADAENYRRGAVMVHLATGSAVGAWIIKGDAPKDRKTIVVFVHGGPGLYTEQRRIEEGAVFRQAGFATAYYDRAGGGVSERLPASEYSFEREMRDLDAFRLHLGADRIILWGNSFGAALAAAYAAQHPEHVAALVLTSPGTFPGRPVERDFSRTERMPVAMSKQMRDAVALIDAKGPAAEKQLSQGEAGTLFDELVSNQLADGFICKGAGIASPPLPGGGNLYAQRLIAKSATQARISGDLRGRIPTLIIRGSCDFMPATNAAQYEASFGGEIVTLEAVGHGLLENRAAVDHAIATFLASRLANAP